MLPLLPMEHKADKVQATINSKLVETKKLLLDYGADPVSRHNNMSDLMNFSQV